MQNKHNPRSLNNSSFKKINIIYNFLKKMAPIDPSVEVYEHGMAVNPECTKIQCCHCGKYFSDFNILQYHLGGIQENVIKCHRVPTDVKNFFKQSLSSGKCGRLRKEVIDKCHSEPSRKRKCASNEKADKMKSGNVTGSLNDQARGQKPRLGNSNAGKSLREPVSGVRASEKGRSYKEGQDSATIMAKRSIGRFFFENVVDYGAVTSPSFKSMMECQKSGDNLSIPSIAELRGWILDDELVDIQNYVKEVMLSWPRTGCSILIDGWNDHWGRSVVNIIVDCPEGPIYLHSADVSPSRKGSNALPKLLEAVVEEVGVRNVVQIIAHTSSDSMLEAVSKQMIEKYRSLFWNVSASHCISLMLDNIAMMNSIKLTLDRAKTITKFIYSHADLLQLLRRHISSHDLVIPSKIKVAASFMTLENLVLERSNLESMFTSSEWLNSSWASSVQGKNMTKLIGDKSFWKDAIFSVKASIPLVKAISLIYQSREPTVGFIYETMDQVKETISSEFGGKKSKYMPFWNIIDDVWNTILHSPLHASGYFLNPRLHYTKDFFSDSEVAGGVLVTVVRLAEDQRTQDLISQQLKAYDEREGDFKLGIEKDSLEKLPLATWWSRFSCQCPDLQKFAIKVVSQTCEGAGCYDLRRDLAEKLLSTGRNPIEQQRLHDLTYVHYNLKLKKFKMGKKCSIKCDEIDPSDDWIVDELHLPEEVGPSGVRPFIDLESEL